MHTLEEIYLFARPAHIDALFLFLLKLLQINVATSGNRQDTSKDIIRSEESPRFLERYRHGLLPLGLGVHPLPFRLEQRLVRVQEELVHVVHGSLVGLGPHRPGQSGHRGMEVPSEGGQLPQGRLEGPAVGGILGVGGVAVLHGGTARPMDEAGALPMAAEEVADQSQDEEGAGRRGREGAAAKSLAEGSHDVGGEHVALGQAAGEEAEEARPVPGVEVARRHQPVQRGVELGIFQTVVHHQHKERVQREEGGDAADLVGAGADVGEAEGGGNDGQDGRGEMLEGPLEGPVGQSGDLQDGQPRLLQRSSVLGGLLPRGTAVRAW